MQLEGLLETLHYNLGIECCLDLRFIEVLLLLLYYRYRS